MCDQSTDEIRRGLEALLPRFWRFALSLTGRRDQAEDLVQTTCVRMLARAHRYEPGTHLDRWGFTLMLNLWRSEIRRPAASQMLDIDDCDEPAAGENHSPEQQTYHRQVLAEIDRLPAEQRVAVTLVYGEGFSYREAADLMETPIGTVMSRLHAARRRLAHLSDR